MSTFYAFLRVLAIAVLSTIAAIAAAQAAESQPIGSFSEDGATYGEVYDCPDAVMSRYPLQTGPPPSRNLKSQEGEDQYIFQHFFSDSRGNTDMRFIEIGALDGVKFSNSFYFEKELGWKGVLIEGETQNFASLEKNRRGENVTCLHLAICAQPRIISLTGTGPMAAENSRTNGGGEQRKTTVPCLPMREVLAMVGLTHVDFYSIDVEGAELDLITSHDFVAVPAHVLMIEMRKVDEAGGGNAEIRSALSARQFCRFAYYMGHSNEVWVNPNWTDHTADG
jgi:FkbM family methyltransferase